VLDAQLFRRQSKLHEAEWLIRDALPRRKSAKPAGGITTIWENQNEARRL